jgi:hypothetical protein
MIKEERRKGGATCYIRKYRDWMEFVSYAEKVLAGREGRHFNGMNCSSLAEDNNEWAGTESLEQAVEFAHRGWSEGRKMVRAVRNRMKIDKLFPQGQRIARSVDTSGDEPDIDLYLSDEPEHMVTINETINPQHGKVLRFLLSRTGACYIPAETMLNRGVAVGIAVETLMMMGFTVEIAIVFAVDQGGSSYEQYVPILHAGDPINLDTLAFMLLQPSVLRRLDFATEECEPQIIRETFGFHNNGGYGRPCRPLFLPQHDLFIDWEEGLVDSDEGITEFAKEILKKFGITQ